MLSLDVFLPRLLPMVAGCSEPLARQSLLDSAIRFCELTSIAREVTYPQPVEQGYAIYSLGLSSEKRVATVLKAWYETVELAPAPASIIDDILAFTTTVGADTAPTGEPRYYYEVASGEYAIYPVPEASGDDKLSFRVATKPSRDATTVENVLYEDWIEAIVYGARSILHGTPDSLFTNPGQATKCEGQFLLAVGRAKVEVMRGRVQASMTITPRPFI